MVKDYGFLFRDDPALAGDAAAVASLACDISEFIDRIGLNAATAPTALRVAYQSACSLRHGQKIHRQPIALLKRCGFEVVEPTDGHLCCGSAGTYNILQGDIAGRLRDRKLASLAAVNPQAIASGNVGCMVQLADGAPCPVLHTAELLDWATGGPRPEALQGGE
jgi:glycolate oxidase iron-sulfur subunit